MNEVITRTLRDFSLDAYKPIIPRSLDLGEPLSPRAGNLVKVVIGMRRSGKSYRLFQEMERLISSGVLTNRICYFDFDDDRLKPITPVTGDAVLEAFYAINPSALSEGAYLFFDELQEMAEWGSWLRRIVATRKATIYVSGSSSKMLSTEIATEFRGRALDFELLPFSFREYAAAHDIAGLDAVARSTEEELRLEEAFRRYLRDGGFPATFDLPESRSVALLQSYVQRVVARDVIERHNVRQPRVAALFAQRLLGTNARQLSLRKTANDLRSAGIPTSKETLGDLLSYFQEAYLVFAIHELSFSLSESTTSQPKVYAVDPGLALAGGIAHAADEGQRLEDVVYLELRRRMPGMRRESIASLRTKGHGYEVDFVVGDALSGELYDLYQVCVDVDDAATYEREVRALWEALAESRCEEATLIVGRGVDAVLERDGKRIVQVPAWKWLLGGCALRL